MTLTSEEMDEVPDVDAATLDEVLSSDAYGKFAVFSKSRTAFIQAGNDWQPGAECQKFVTEHDSDPWVLEYRERRRQFRASGQVTLDQVREAFRSYLGGGEERRDGFEWVEIEV